MVNNTIKLSVIAIFAFILQSTIPGFTEAFLLQSSDVLFRPWILITSIFLHGDITHIMYNLFGLVLFGSILEKEIGKYYLPLFFASGLMASLAATLFYPAALGASGALFGVMGALAMIKPRLTVWVIGVPMPMIMAAGVWLLIDIIGLYSPSGTANAAHIGGLLFGAAVAYFFFKREEIHKKENNSVLSEKEIDEWENEHMR
jgi:uncharacterized protein